MKTIARTEIGNVLVEMSVNEYAEFLKLEASLTERGYEYAFESPHRGSLQGIELSPIFRALNDLATAKQSITTLQSYINNLANSFGRVQPLPETREIDA